MRHIPPAAHLRDYDAWVARHPAASWDDVRAADQGGLYAGLRNHLQAHQNGLCAFCEIDLIESDVEIEHWHPKKDPARPPNWALHFPNLQAACKGGASEAHPWANLSGRDFERDAGNLSCGAKKGEIRPEGVIYHPQELPESPSIFSVDFQGVIRVNEDLCRAAHLDARQTARTLERLGLDCPRLRRAREAWWNEVSEAMIALSPQHEPHEIAARYLSSGPDGKLPKFFTTLRSMFGQMGERILAQTRNPEITET